MPSLSRVRPLVALLACGALHFAFAVPARAQSVKPWMPPFADSLQIWASEARAEFRANQGDSVGGTNSRAYELVGIVSRRLLRSLGRANIAQAGAIEAILDSLGLESQVVMDPEQPNFALVMVHNPFRPTAHAIGFLQWWRGEDLRLQGIRFEGGRDARLRVWWTGASDVPYQAAIIENRRGDPEHLVLTVLGLQPTGGGWTVFQHEGNLRLPPTTEARFVDLNRDGRPELITWGPATMDSTFERCGECPQLQSETTFVLRNGSFEPFDSRLMPSPFSTFTLFVRLLGDGNRTAAARLLRDPTRLDLAVKAGFGATNARRGAWKLEYAEDNEAWPRWLALRHVAGTGRPLYIVHFGLRDGRWVILDWLEAKSGRPAAVRGG